MTADCSFRTIATSLVLWMSYNLGFVPNIRQIWTKTRFIKGGVRLRNMKPSQTHPQLAGNMASHSSHWDRMRSRSGKSFAMRQPRRQLGPSMIENPRTEPHDIPTSSYIYIASRRGCDSEGFSIFEHCSSSNLQHSRKRIWRATLKSKSSSLIRNYPTHQWYANDIVSASSFDPQKTSPSQPFSAPPWPRPNRQRPGSRRSRRSGAGHRVRASKASTKLSGGCAPEICSVLRMLQWPWPWSWADGFQMALFHCFLGIQNGAPKTPRSFVIFLNDEKNT